MRKNRMGRLGSPARVRRALWIGLAATCLAGPVFAAEVFEKVGTYDAQFLKIGIGARAAGMGGAYAAVADDPTGVFWNAAGIASIADDKTEISLDHTEWPAGLNFDYAGVVFHIRGLPGAIGVHARSLSMKEEPVRTAFRPEGSGEFFDAGYAAYGLTYARFLTDKFSVGVGANLVHMGLADLSQQSVTFDLGTLYSVGTMGMKIAMAIQNIGSSVTFIEREGRVPTVFRIGTSFQNDPESEHHLIGSFDFSHPPDNAERLNLGGEYAYKQFLYGRLGYNFNYDAETWAAGAGVEIPVSISDTRAKLDYAYTDMSDLGGVHRFSLIIRF
jgi:hypothetical protein